MGKQILTYTRHEESAHKSDESKRHKHVYYEFYGLKSV